MHGRVSGKEQVTELVVNDFPESHGRNSELALCHSVAPFPCFKDGA